MARPARRADRAGHDGPPPRPRAARRSTGSSWSPWPTRAVTRTASPARRRCCHGVEDLIAAGHRLLRRRLPDRAARGDRPRAGRGRRARADREAAGAVASRRPSSSADAFEARGLVGAVGHIERYNPALQSLRARLENGELGDVYQVVTRRQGPFPARIADVGVVMDLATHDIDLTAWVTGSDYACVSARTRLPQRPPARGHGRRGRPAGRRHGDQPPGQLAVAR